MNRLLPWNIVDTPEAIIRTELRTTHSRKLITRIFAHAGEGKPLDARLRQRVLHYPELLAELLTDGVLSEKDRMEFAHHVPGALNALLENFEELAPRIESKMYHDLSAVEQIYWFVKGSGMEGSLRLADYASRLLVDPVRTFRITPLEDRAAVQRTLRERSETEKHTSAAWAHFYISSHVIDLDVPLPSELMLALKTSEEYSWLTARLMFLRDAEPYVYAPLLAHIRTPRWAYHCLRDGLADGAEQSRLLDLLHHAPEWAAEYYTHKEGMTEETLKTAYETIVGCSPQHPLIEELHVWRLQRSWALRFEPGAADTDAIKATQRGTD
jgi:hypothetical protein